MLMLPIVDMMASIYSPSATSRPGSPHDALHRTSTSLCAR